MSTAQRNYVWSGLLLAVFILTIQNAAAAVVIVDAERFVEAEAGALSSGLESVLDDPTAIQVFGTDPLFDETINASVTVDVASGAANSSQISTFASTGIAASGSYSAEGSYTGEMFGNGTGGGSAQLRFGGSGGGELITATNESVDFDLSGFLPAVGVYELDLNLIGLAEAETPPFGEFSQSSSGSFILLLRSYRSLSRLQFGYLHRPWGCLAGCALRELESHQLLRRDLKAAMREC